MAFPLGLDRFGMWALSVDGGPGLCRYWISVWPLCSVFSNNAQARLEIISHSHTRFKATASGGLAYKELCSCFSAEFEKWRWFASTVAAVCWSERVVVSPWGMLIDGSVLSPPVLLYCIILCFCSGETPALRLRLSQSCSVNFVVRWKHKTKTITKLAPLVPPGVHQGPPQGLLPVGLEGCLTGRNRLWLVSCIWHLPTNQEKKGIWLSR